MKRCLYAILLVGLMFSAPRAEEPILTGSAVKELGGDPPPAPMGYPNTAALFAAIKLGFV